MGIGGSLAMENFSPGICDALGVYLYPYHNGKLNKSTRRELTYIMHLAKSLQPDIGLIGIPQLFQEQEGAHNIHADAGAGARGRPGLPGAGGGGLVRAASFPDHFLRQSPSKGRAVVHQPVAQRLGRVLHLENVLLEGFRVCRGGRPREMARLRPAGTPHATR